MKLGSGHLSIVQLALLKVQILLHLVDLVLGGQLALSAQVFLHVLEQGCDHLLVLGDLLLVFLLLLVELLLELVYFLFLGGQDFKLASIAVIVGFPSDFVRNFTDLALVGLDNLLNFRDVLLLLLDFGIVLLDTIHKTLTCLREWEIHFVGLKFQIFFALYKLSFLIAQVLGTLLQRVSSQTLL